MYVNAYKAITDLSYNIKDWKQIAGYTDVLTHIVACKKYIVNCNKSVLFK